MEAGGPNGPITLRAYVPEYKGDSGTLRRDVTRVSPVAPFLLFLLPPVPSERSLMHDCRFYSNARPCKANAMALANLLADSRFAITSTSRPNRTSSRLRVSRHVERRVNVATLLRRVSKRCTRIVRIPRLKSAERKSLVRWNSIFLCRSRGSEGRCLARGEQRLLENSCYSPVFVYRHAARCPRAPVVLTGFRHPHAVSPHQTHK